MIRKIVSGGQTGADRAALDVALFTGLECGGWVPKGRLAEDGLIAATYPNLVEADSVEPRVRTELNVRDSDATVVLTHGAPTGGSAVTLEAATQAGKPALHLDLDVTSPPLASRRLAAWLDDVNPQTLNVAGPRSSEDPTIYELTRSTLSAALGARPVTLDVRAATLGDADAVAEAYLRSRKELVACAPLVHSDEAVRDWIRRRLIPAGSTTLAVVDGLVVGFVAVSKGADCSWIDHLYLRPAWVGRGIGTRLLDLARSELPPPIRLYTFRCNQRARSFYERRGFEAIALGDGSGNEEKCPDVLYEWRPGGTT